MGAGEGFVLRKCGGHFGTNMGPWMVGKLLEAQGPRCCVGLSARWAVCWVALPLGV